MTGKHILIIEDNPEQVEFLLSKVLSPHGYPGQTANCAQAGIQAAQSERPNLVLLDLNLKDMTSIEVLQELQIAGDPPVIVMAPTGAEAQALQALRLGARDALIKPFSAEEVTQAIGRVLNQERLEGERDQLVRRLAAANKGLENSLIKAQRLYDIGVSVGSNLDRQEALRAVVQAAVSLTGAEEGYLLLRDPDNNKLLLQAALDRGQDRACSSDATVAWADGVAQQVAQLGKPVILSSPSRVSVKVKTGYFVRSLVNVPLWSQNQVIGVLGVDNVVSDQEFTQQDVKLLSALADYAVIAIKNAQSPQCAPQAVDRRAQESLALQALWKLGKNASQAPSFAAQALTQALRITKAVDGVVGLRPHGCAGKEKILWINSKGTIAKPKSSLAQIARVALNSGKSQQSQRSSPASSAPELYLAAPICGQVRAWGAIGLCLRITRSSGQEFDATLVQEDLRFLGELAEYIAERLDHLHLLTELRATQQKANLLLKKSAEGIYTVDKDLRITYANPAMERITGWKKSELLGQRYDVIFAPEFEGRRLAPKETLPGKALRVEVCNSQSAILRKDKRRILVSGSATLLKDAANSPSGVLVTMQDLTPKVEARQLREQFTAIAAHWLRTPLSQISASANKLLQANLPDDVRSEVLNLLKTQSVELGQLTEEITDTLSLETNPRPADPHPVTLKPIIDQVVGNFQRAAPGQSLQVTLESELPFVLGDEPQIELALANLIDNALLMGDRRQPLKVSAMTRDGHVVVTVGRNANNAAGNSPPPAPSDHRYAHWPQEKSQTSTPTSALGRLSSAMGLQVAKRLIHAQGGQTWTESSPGTETRFYFSLPKMETENEEQAIVD